MKNIKYIIWVLVIVVWALFVYFNFLANTTSANPDYICVKSVDRSCEIDENQCSEWAEDWTRICPGNRVTKVAYYHVRTACEAWYTVSQRWDTATASTAARFADQSALTSKWRDAHKAHPTSGRHSIDFIYWTENCSIKQVDTERPSWEVKQIN